MIEKIVEHFGNLTVSRGNKHKLLGTDIELLVDGKLSVFMKYYIEESIDFFGEELITKLSSPSEEGSAEHR